MENITKLTDFVNQITDLRRATENSFLHAFSSSYPDPKNFIEMKEYCKKKNEALAKHMEEFDQRVSNIINKK